MPIANLRSPFEMERQGSHWIGASLAQRSGNNSPEASQTATALLSIWADIAVALQPVVGIQGVAALYDRSISLTARAHGWIADARTGADTVADLAALRTAVTRQTPVDAMAGADELLHNFYDVLVSLIGSLLSDQLLRSVRESVLPQPTRES